MKLRIKSVGLAFAAVLAMSVVIATSAQAVNFTASSYPASGKGGQTTKHVFTIQGQSVECTELNATGTIAEASPELKLSNATYGGCTAFGFANATIDQNSCYILATAETTTTASGHGLCSTPGDSLTITAGPCVVHVPPQTPTVNKVDLKNEPGGKVLVTSTVEGLHASVTKGSFLCPLSNATTDATGKYVGSTLVESTEGKTLDVG